MVFASDFIGLQFYNVNVGLPAQGFFSSSNFQLILFACRYFCKIDSKKVMYTLSFFFLACVYLSAQDTLQETFHTGVAVSL